MHLVTIYILKDINVNSSALGKIMLPRCHPKFYRKYEKGEFWKYDALCLIYYREAKQAAMLLCLLFRCFGHESHLKIGLCLKRNEDDFSWVNAKILIVFVVKF